MRPVRRHRIGEQMPGVSHPGADPAAIALCRDLVAEAAVDCAILFGSRARGGWDEQSDLDIIVIHQRVGDEEEERSVVDYIEPARRPPPGRAGASVCRGPGGSPGAESGRGSARTHRSNVASSPGHRGLGGLRWDSVRREGDRLGRSRLRALSRWTSSHPS